MGDSIPFLRFHFLFISYSFPIKILFCLIQFYSFPIKILFISYSVSFNPIQNTLNAWDFWWSFNPIQ